MTAAGGYLLIAGPAFDLDYRRIDAAARRSQEDRSPSCGVRSSAPCSIWPTADRTGITRWVTSLARATSGTAAYAHTCARLGRHLFDQQPGLNRFATIGVVTAVNAADRQSEMDTRRAIAHAWAGQQPLRSSRPLTVGTSPQTHRPTDTTPNAAPRNARPGPTGRPSREHH
ncbi:hypothetical protein GCM10009534_24110 [Kribbella sandramycini]